ncbi:hypothetical protein SUGI_1080250 [Cryptomeria japonica]|nr:hypothetical protein SUGI_1080250 [Cryptomeria japonica]
MARQNRDMREDCRKRSKYETQEKGTGTSYSRVVDDNGSLELEANIETDLGLVSKCYLTKDMFKMTRQYIANVVFKINVKSRLVE